MPWCDHCSKYWNPSSMNPDGSCPSCGRVLAKPAASAGGEGGPPVSEPRTEPTPYDPQSLDVKELAGGEKAKAPWHFKLLIVALVIYLAWRLVQLVVWLVH